MTDSTRSKEINHMTNTPIYCNSDLPKPHKVLVIGNGFDLAHGLLTSYEYFLDIMKEPSGFEDYFRATHLKDMLKVVTEERNNPFQKHVDCVTDINAGDDIHKMIEILKRNSWVQYYTNCNAEINGWVDFEREMLSVIRMFNAIVSNGSRPLGLGDDYAIVRIPDVGMRRIARLWPKYIKEAAPVTLRGESMMAVDVTVESAYSDKWYGVVVTRLLDDLKSDLDEFLEAFCIYLSVFVESQKDISLRSLFENMEVSNIINFNYTHMIQYHYKNLKDVDMHFVHGLTVNKDSEKMIFGVNVVDNDAEYRFKEFEKRYQRLCNDIKQGYKDAERGLYDLIIYGHSLDITDKAYLSL